MNYVWQTFSKEIYMIEMDIIYYLDLKRAILTSSSQTFALNIYFLLSGQANTKIEPYNTYGHLKSWNILCLLKMVGESAGFIEEVTA